MEDLSSDTVWLLIALGIGLAFIILWVVDLLGPRP